VVTLLVGEREDEGAGVGGVQHSKAIGAWLDFKIGSELAVDHHCVTVEFGDPGSGWVAGVGIVERAVGGEEAIGKDEGNFIFAAG
jgi:hypothetical protein